MKNVLILGIGNFLLGDEGVGVHAVRLLDQMEWPAGVDLVDGGTGGFHLLHYLEEYPVIVMIDATMDDRPPGTIVMLEPKYASDFPPSLSAHDIGLRDLVNSAQLLGHSPKIYLFTITVEDISELRTELTPAIEVVLPQVLEKVRELVFGLTV